MGRTRVAVIGVGTWGLSHLRTLAAEPRAELTWVCDLDAAALRSASAVAPTARATQSFDEVLGARDVDAIVIVTPAVTHADLAVKALRRGRHVLIEKPLALSVADAERVVEAAQRAGTTVLVGHLMLYHPAVDYLRKLVSSRELGDIFYLSSVRANLGRLRRDENALWSFGPHDLSMIDHLIPGTPVTVTARGASYLQPGIADVVFVNLELTPPGGPRAVMAQIHLSWLNPRKERRLTIVGSKKMVEFDDCVAEKVCLYDRGYDRPPEFSSFAEYLTLRNGDIYIPQVAMEEPLAAQIRHFLDCIAANAQPRTDLASGVRVVRLLAAAQSSLERGGAPVQVP
ncbi:MAG: Gfo/Idh/MocA family oxidoreductase [Deltaproteobacteria bacterium]|nr:Gfo/Idh/MocA family oxidoreductase [Kofleriaceae bacterium]